MINKERRETSPKKRNSRNGIHLDDLDQFLLLKKKKKYFKSLC